MTDFFNWSIDLGRWRGTRVRVHYGLVLSAALAFWVSGLVLLSAGYDVAERVVPAGILRVSSTVPW